MRGSGLWRAWDRLSIYLPVILMGFVALGTYWLARSTPTFTPASAQQAPTHDPDYFMRRFSIKSFEPGGRLKSDIRGTEARHYPDTDTFEIDEPRIRAVSEQGVLTFATAKRALSNADGSEVQLFGDAVVTRDATKDAQGRSSPRMEMRSEFIHAFMEKERVVSNKPVRLLRGNDEFHADSMQFDNLAGVLQLQGRVRGQLTSDARARGAP